jgi:hypothetical protein
MGGTIPDDDQRVLISTIRQDLRDRVEDLAFDVSPHAYSTLIIRITMRQTSPLMVLTQVSESLDHALMNTGLFEKFDSSGRMMWVAPVERAGATDAPGLTVE